jgi:ActR/RegA family two-component response regulator
MLVNALLLSSDPALLGVLRRSAEELGIRPQDCATVTNAAAVLSSRRFEGIIIDADDLAGAGDFIEALRKTPSNKSSIIVAVVNGRTTPCDAFRKGANMVLEKPVTSEKLGRSLRAAHSMMTRERRRALRIRVDMPVMLKTGSGSAEDRAAGLDISEGGVGVESLVALKLHDIVRFRCVLPESEIELQGTAEIVNATRDGHAGLAFVGISQEHRSELAHWLASRIEQQSASALRMGPHAAGAPARQAAAGAR